MQPESPLRCPLPSLKAELGVALQASGSKDGSPGLLEALARADASAYWAWVGWGLLISLGCKKESETKVSPPAGQGLLAGNDAPALLFLVTDPAPPQAHRARPAGLRLHFNPLWPTLTSEDFVLQYIAMGGGV